MKEILKPAAALFVIALACALCLGYIHGITEEPIRTAEEKAKNAALNELIPDADTFLPIPLSDNYTPEGGALVTEAYTAKDAAGLELGCCIFAESKGYAGAVGILAAIDTDGRIIGISVVKSSETPGLGTLAGGDKFTSQFTGQTGGFTVTKSIPADSSEIAAVSGATISSSAVTNAVNAAYLYYEQNIK